MQGADVSLLEDPEADAGVTTTDSDGSNGSMGGPAVTVETGGSTITLDTETLQFYLLVVQTLTLSYVAYKEVTR